MGCEGSKSLGPDGYNVFFLRKCWHFLKDDFTHFVKDFHNDPTLSKVVTSLFFTLIPKVENLLNLDDYRPICLVGCMLKFISKLLAARIIIVLHD